MRNRWKVKKSNCSGKLKNQIVLKMWGRERRKVGKVSQEWSFLETFGRKHPQIKQLQWKTNNTRSSTLPVFYLS